MINNTDTKLTELSAELAQDMSNPALCQKGITACYHCAYDGAFHPLANCTEQDCVCRKASA